MHVPLEMPVSLKMPVPLKMPVSLKMPVTLKTPISLKMLICSENTKKHVPLKNARFTIKVKCILLKNDGNPISLQERARVKTTNPRKKGKKCEPIVLYKTSDNMQLCRRKWSARLWKREQGHGLL